MDAIETEARRSIEDNKACDAAIATTVGEVANLVKTVAPVDTTKALEAISAQLANVVEQQQVTLVLQKEGVPPMFLSPFEGHSWPASVNDIIRALRLSVSGCSLQRIRTNRESGWQCISDMLSVLANSLPYAALLFHLHYTR